MFNFIDLLQLNQKFWTRTFSNVFLTLLKKSQLYLKVFWFRILIKINQEIKLCAIIRLSRDESHISRRILSGSNSERWLMLSLGSGFQFFPNNYGSLNVWQYLYMPLVKLFKALSFFIHFKVLLKYINFSPNFINLKVF